jgi:hypothetical protein
VRQWYPLDFPTLFLETNRRWMLLCGRISQKGFTGNSSKIDYNEQAPPALFQRNGAHNYEKQ